jgi:type IV secretory pathway VirB2 component (pilin)
MIKKIKKIILILPSYVFAGSASSGKALSQVSNVAAILQDTVTGPMGMVCSIVAIVGAGIAWAMSDHGTGVRKFSAVAVGIILIVNAVGWYTSLWGANV